MGILVYCVVALFAHVATTIYSPQGVFTAGMMSEYCRYISGTGALVYRCNQIKRIISAFLERRVVMKKSAYLLVSLCLVIGILLIAVADVNHGYGPGGPPAESESATDGTH